MFIYVFRLYFRIFFFFDVIFHFFILPKHIMFFLQMNCNSNEFSWAFLFLVFIPIFLFFCTASKFHMLVHLNFVYFLHTITMFIKLSGVANCFNDTKKTGNFFKRLKASWFCCVESEGRWPKLLAILTAHHFCCDKSF